MRTVRLDETTGGAVDIVPGPSFKVRPTARRATRLSEQGPGAQGDADTSAALKAFGRQFPRATAIAAVGADSAIGAAVIVMQTPGEFVAVPFLAEESGRRFAFAAERAWRPVTATWARGGVATDATGVDATAIAHESAIAELEERFGIHRG